MRAGEACRVLGHKRKTSGLIANAYLVSADQDANGLLGV